MMIIIILIGIFAYFDNRVKSQDELRFVEDQRTCNGRLAFEMMPTDDFFKSYQNTTGSSVSDCVDRCYRKFQFCHAVRFDDLQKICFYSYKSPMKCNGKDQESVASTSDGKTSATVSCIACVGESQKIESAKKVLVVESKKTTTSTTNAVNSQTSDSGTIESSTSTTSSTSSTSTVQLTTTVTTTNELSSTVVTSTSTQTSETLGTTTVAPSSIAVTSKSTQTSETLRTTTVASTITPVQASSAEKLPTETTKRIKITPKFEGRIISTKVPTTELLIQNTVEQSTNDILLNNRIDNSIDENILKKKSAKFVKNLQPLAMSRAQHISPRFGTKCNSALQSPCSRGVGRDCSLVEGATCQICKCPLKSAARGCLGPYGLNETYRLALLTNAERCPNGRRAQKVFRFQRIENPMTDDLCDAVMQPYCGYQLDKESWRMPRSVDECHFFCFTDQELLDKNVDGKNLQRLFAQ
uniref:Apple domain-containing protein n=1 Tax=Romanomermis culicivorax TaxID=13658 RepID=A0A915K032_ROMCU